jgi:hypothetical protein
MELKKAYPNYVQAMIQMKDTTDLTQCKSNSKVLSYGMSYIVYGNKLADIYIDLNKYEDFIYVSFTSYKGLIEKAKTTGERIFNDLDVEEWRGIIAQVMNQHNANPKHAQLVMDFTRKRVNTPKKDFQSKKSGCILTLIILILPILTYSLINF